MSECSYPFFRVGAKKYIVEPGDFFSENCQRVLFVPIDKSKLGMGISRIDYKKNIVVPPTVWTRFIDEQYESKFKRVLGRNNTVLHKTLF